MQTVANGTASHKEISWDDMIDGNLPPHEPPTVDEQHLAYFRQAVSQAAATMDSPPYNDQKGKLLKAMDLVLTGKVTHEDGLYAVQGSTRPV